MEDFDFDIGFFDYAEKNEYTGDVHPQDEVEDAINEDIQMEEEY